MVPKASEVFIPDPNTHTGTAFWKFPRTTTGVKTPPLGVGEMGYCLKMGITVHKLTLDSVALGCRCCAQIVCTVNENDRETYAQLLSHKAAQFCSGIEIICFKNIWQ